MNPEKSGHHHAYQGEWEKDIAKSLGNCIPSVLMSVVPTDRGRYDDDDS